MRTIRVIVAAAFVGAFGLPVVVFAVSAVIHWLNYGNWQEFWGLILAIRAVPLGAIAGGVCGWLLSRRGASY